MFLGARAFAARPTATIAPTDAATTHRVAAISGDRTVAANEWACSRSGENKSSSQPSSAALRSVPAATTDKHLNTI